MEITYLGRSCFKVAGKNINILIDPFDPDKVGQKLSKQEADVVLVTHDHYDHNNVGVLKNDFLLLNTPGEYEVRDSEFVGVVGYHDDQKGAERGKITMFAFEVDGIKICHLGDLGAELVSEQLEKLDGVDVLMIPVGGKYTIDAKAAVKVISQIEPKVVIPMHYKDTENNGLEPLSVFLQEMGVSPEIQDRLKLAAKDLPEELTVVTLTT